MDSIMQEPESGCFICGSFNGLQKHHCIPGSGRRKKCDEYGLTVQLCFLHHGGNQDVHTIRTDWLAEIRRVAQRVFEQTHSREDFIMEFGINFL